MTDLYGIIGDPVAQVRSPAVFNARFEAAGLDAVMVPLHVVGDNLDRVIAGLRAIENLAGLVITVPHKPAAARLLRTCSDRVRMAGAANVLRPVPGGWDGDLFDGEGFAIGLEANGFQLAGQRCALVGAGGAGAAIAVALLSRGIADLTIVDIDEGKALGLVARLQELNQCPVSVGRPGSTTDLAINATPLGMDSQDPLPFDVAPLRPNAVVAEAIMKPPVTRLLTEAVSHGCRIQEGRHMLDHQVDAIWNFFILSQDANDSSAEEHRRRVGAFCGFRQPGQGTGRRRTPNR